MSEWPPMTSDDAHSLVTRIAEEHPDWRPQVVTVPSIDERLGPYRIAVRVELPDGAIWAYFHAASYPHSYVGWRASPSHDADVRPLDAESYEALLQDKIDHYRAENEEPPHEVYGIVADAYQDALDQFRRIPR